MSTQTDFYNWQAGQGVPVEPYQSYDPTLGGGNTTGTAPTSPTASTPSGGQSSASMPNYSSIFANDPLYRQLEANLSAQSGEDKAQRDATIQSRLIQFGQIPSNLSIQGVGANDLANLLSPAVQQSAALNTSSGMSELARMIKAYQDTQRGVQNNLAARGILRSGETGYQMGQANLGYQQTRYDATNSMLQYLAGAEQAFATAERQRTQQLFQGEEDAYNRSLALYPNLGGGGSGGGGSNPNPPQPGTQYTGGPTVGGWNPALTNFYNQSPNLAQPYQPSVSAAS